MRSWIGAILLATFVLSASVPSAWAVAIPIVDPGFDLYTANTTTLVPDNRLPFQTMQGAGGGPVEDVPLVDFNTFQSAGTGDIPAGWIATGKKPAGDNNTGRGRFDTGFDAHTSGSVASINSFGADAYESPPGSGMFISTPGRFTQVLTGVTVLPNTLYTATINVMDIDITGRGPFQPVDDNVVPGNRGRADDPATPNIDETINRIILGLFAVSPTAAVDLGGVLEFTDITPGGFFTDSDANPMTPEFATSGGKSLLTLTVLTGATVPAGDLTISFTAGGAAENLHGFAPSAQTFFDNATLDATPFAAMEDADFDGDNDVDGNDFLIFQRGLGMGGQTNNSNGDADGSGTVDGADLVIFRNEFGMPQATGAVAAIPEPTSGALGVLALLSGWATWSRRGRNAVSIP